MTATADQHVIYLDYQATTPLDSRVLDAMLPYLTSAFGNPASPHAPGHRAAEAVRTARRQVRDLIGANSDTEIVFTSGATEADHLALAGIAHAFTGRRRHIITTAIEHKAVLSTCRHLQGIGFDVTVLPVDCEGLVDPADVAAAITPATVLVSVMHANSEIGTIQPLAEISAITRDCGVLLHTDAAQTLGSVRFDVDELGVDLASFSGHKFYGPKGVGALYVRRGSVRPVPQILGGGQEHGLRAGTLNVPGIVGLGAAAALLVHQRDDDARRILTLRNRLLGQLHDTVADLRVNGSLTRRLPGNLSVTFPGADADQLLERLPGLALSTGSACNTGQAEPSHVLTAIGITRADARATLRISLGRPTTEHEVDTTARTLLLALRGGDSH
ncbi:cysteine desulfurase family protein (plasmid) [Microtetraspora malaysiensis]|uniref:cysteine desulfurase family protein n=1 Tax=Microtetraspora malaysiensis TaxID=161358 RepID=UPI003D94F6C0